MATKGRSIGTDQFTQTSLGFFATALEAAAAFAAAATEAKESLAAEAAERYIKKDPITPLLEKAKAAGANPDMNNIFKEADKEEAVHGRSSWHRRATRPQPRARSGRRLQ